MRKNTIVNLTNLFALICFIIFVSCKRENNLNYIENNTSIETVLVRRVEENRGVLVMKIFSGDYYVYSWCPILNSNSLPNWIKEKKVHDVSDINPPYKIFKTKNEKIFSIIKNADTLKFEIVKTN